MLFSRTVLPSRIRVVTERMPEVRSASIGFWVAVGSRDEPIELQGSSHLLEHVLFKGTEKRSSREIAESFESVGGEANAFSAKEYTCFFGRVLDKDLPMATEVLVDMLTSGALRPEDVESEKKVVLEEIAMREDMPDDTVHDLFAETLFGDHPLSREVMGTIESVGSITADTLRGFYSTYYGPVNIVVAAAGSVDHTALVGAVENAFPTDGGTPVMRKLDMPASTGRLRVIHRPTEQAHIVIGGLGYSRHHPDRFAWGVLDDLLGGASASRLFQEVREKRGLAYSVYSYRNLFSETGLYAIYAGTAPGKVMEVLKVIEDELDRLLDEGAAEPELERAKGHSRGGLVLSLEDPSSRMSRLGRSELVHGEILSIDELISRVDAVTLEDVSRVARDLLRPEGRILTVVGPFTEEDFAWWSVEPKAQSL
jgi:predicted Zn-dependent peptidase